MVIFPYYAIMFSDRSHLSTLEISALFGWWTIVALVSELPTGTLADKLSRRTAIILSDVLRALAFITWLVLPTFLGYALGFLLWGISFALNSGAFQAYLYDELSVENNTHDFTKIFGRSQSIGLIGMLVAYLIASLIGQNYTLALILSIGVSLISAYIASLFPMPNKIAGNEDDKISQITLLKSAIIQVINSRLLMRLVLTLSVAITLSAAMEEYVPLYDKMVGVPIPIVPLVLAIGLTLSAILAWFAHRFETRTRLFGVISLGIAGVILFATSYSNTAMAVAGIIIFMRLVNLASLLYQSSLQHHISGKSRATVGSLPTFISEILYIAVVAIYGIISAIYNDFASIRVIALGTFIIGILLWWYWKGYKLQDRSYATKN
jgi:MFS family permease